MAWELILSHSWRLKARDQGVCRVHFLLFFSLSVLLFIEHVARGLVKKPKGHVVIRRLRFFLCFHWAAVVQGAGPPAGVAPATGAGPPAPTLSLKLPVLTLARALAKKPGQKGSTFTLAAFMRALILSSVTVPSLLCRTGGRVAAGELRDGGHGTGESWACAVGCSAGRRMKRGPHPNVAFGFSEGLSTSPAAEERPG